MVSDERTTHASGEVRDAILQVRSLTAESLPVNEIAKRVAIVIGPAL